MSNHTPFRQPPETPLTCAQIIAVLAEYVAGDMDTATCATFEEHLRDCRECMAFLATYQTTIAAIRAVRDEELPAALLSRVQAFLRARVGNVPIHTREHAPDAGAGH
jgi:anti-sigma factor RsiW